MTSFPTLNQSTTGNAATATIATTATNIAAGVANDIPYQTGAGATGFIAPVDSAVLCTSAGGVPSECTTLPAVSGANLTNLPATVPTISGTGQGFYTPTVYVPSTEASEVMAATANTAYCKQFYLPFTRTVTHGFFYIGSTSASTTGDVGIYSTAGSLLADTGSISTASGTAVGGVITQTSVVLTGGTYYWSCATNSGTGPLIYSLAASTAMGNLSNEGTNMTATFTAGVSAGVLPSTMGSLTANGAINIALAWWY
jgi:hypothetical protein